METSLVQLGACELRIWLRAWLSLDLWQAGRAHRGRRFLLLRYNLDPLWHLHLNSHFGRLDGGGGLQLLHQFVDDLLPSVHLVGLVGHVAQVHCFGAVPRLEALVDDALAAIAPQFEELSHCFLAWHALREIGRVLVLLRRRWLMNAFVEQDASDSRRVVLGSRISDREVHRLPQLLAALSLRCHVQVDLQVSRWLLLKHLFFACC